MTVIFTCSYCGGTRHVIFLDQGVARMMCINCDKISLVFPTMEDFVEGKR